MRRVYIITVLLITVSSVFSKVNAPIAEAYSNQESVSITEAVFYQGETPDYGTVFNQSELLTINIEIDQADWEAMNNDLADNFSADDNMRGGSQRMGERPEGMALPEGMERPDGVELPEGMERPERPQGGGRMAPPEGMERPDGMAPPEGMERPPMDGQGNMGGDNVVVVDFDPIQVDSTITFQGEIFEHVAIRFKGNSSLKSAYQSGDDKKSFKLDFDKFDSEYTEVTGRTFYGFDQLNLNNNYNDASQLREKVASDLFRAAGLVSSQTSFCEVFIDYGEGVKSLGIYTIVEERWMTPQ